MKIEITIPDDTTVHQKLIDELQYEGDDQHRQARTLEENLTTEWGKNHYADFLREQRALGDALHEIANAIRKAEVL